MKTREDLKKIREKALEQMKLREGQFSAKVVVAMGTCGIAAGAREVMTAILDELDKRGIIDVAISHNRLPGLDDIHGRLLLTQALAAGLSD